MRVAYTVEQCWHRVPGGSAVTALRTASALERRAEIEVIGVAGRHRRPPDPAFVPNLAMRWLPVGRPALYELWNRANWPRVEAAVEGADVVHSTVGIPAATGLPHVVTVHDIAFRHSPENFTKRGVRVMNRGLERCRDVDVICTPSEVTKRDLIEIGFDAERVRIVPWGVDMVPPSIAAVNAVRRKYALPDRFVLFIGTLEPRKNLTRLVAAVAQLETPIPLVVAGAEGWGAQPHSLDAQFLGFVPPDELAALYGASTVFAYPSLQEGFGMPVLEAMACGTPVVTSDGTATAEVAGQAAVLADPNNVSSIAAGVTTALQDRTILIERGFARAGQFTWDRTAELTAAAYRQAIAGRS